MYGPSLIGCALLILLLLPVLVLDSEDLPVADRFYVLVALGGIGFSGLSQGMAGAATAIAAGLGCLLLVSALVALICARWRLRLLTGGHIKLLAAGATWLSLPGAALMLALAAALFCATAAFLRARKAANPRPDMAVITAAALLSAQLMTLA